ncbi:MAG: holo-ACP synthase [Gammaproteobacteria bacterium]|nr:holo-ACP synthase [Gammaproteobacteria bacterium]MBU1732240.1 holo-ACP synthase [Gammaproteobacteria bacterium]MBU1893810.1 holo-ACP synthase [Gammaproteobacteria bacterium]
MIFGIGTDIVSTSRIAAVWERHGEDFARRILAPQEWAGFIEAGQPARFLAKRFAAKEAFAKALGTGIRAPATWHNIRVTHDDLGKPVLDFDPELAALLARHTICSHHLSISDEKELAAAFVILEK